ncbi:putative Ig domain-containing protein, partial [Candidatus Poseidoniales archaeon]|nr:putative Ig domain-containing protein [Candidatus Poseidoniales archaeon]
MVTMSLSVGIVEISRTPMLDSQDVASVGASCSYISRSAGESIYVDPVNGSDDWDGTWSCPKATLSDALNESSANDEIVLYSGRYHENVTVDGKDNLLIRAANGARVVFDGTQSIADDMGVTWSTADSDGIQEVTLPVDGWQLFLAYDEQVPARWPNAQFSDESVFNRSYWAEGTLTGSNNAYTIGWLTDAGPETGVHTGLNETVNATGLDPEGAIAVMNLGSFRSNSREITDWNSANGTFAYDGTGVGWKTKHHAYFLEGKRELIDVDGEWWFDNPNNRLHYKTPTGQDANNLDLRVKVQPFAIDVENSDGVTIQGIDFFGTTVNFNECDGCSFTNSTLEYPSTSKRGLGIAGESEDDRWMTRFYRSTNSFVDNISITNTDGGALEFQGSAGQSNNNIVNNSYFHAIDWSAADQKGLMTSIYEGGEDMTFSNNTVHLTGASSVLSIGDSPTVLYNEVWDVGHLQTDGAVVQIMQGEAPGAEIAYNWIHDIIKYGIRFDAPIGQAGTGQNGTMHHNVIWNAAGGLMVKGDYHDIHNNTVFNSTLDKNDIIALTDGGINNKNSTFHRNAVDTMADHRSDDVYANPLPNGSHWSNWNGYLQGYDGMFEARNQISCAIYDNSSLYCWGRNDHGQLGLGYTSGREDVPQYVDFGPGRTITSLGIDDSGAEGWSPNSHACAVLDNGELVCWGDNEDGQLGLGNTTTNGVWEPSTVDVGSGLTTISVATGNSATCALLSDHSVKCWGRNNEGQLGLGNTSSNDVLTPHAVTFSGSSNPISLHAGRNEFCAQLDNGAAACWGKNDFGLFGLGNTTSQSSPIPLLLPTGRTIASMNLAKDFMCLTLDNGSVVCAGTNTESQIGQGTVTTSEPSWKYVLGLDMVAHTTELGQDVGCAHLVNGSMVCWGEDAWGLFGNSTTSYTTRTATTATQHVNFGNGRTAASISVNYRHACAILDNGDLACWGRNHKAQLGLGNITQQYMPVVVSNVSTIRQVAIHEMLVDPANDDFRPKWGSHLQQMGAGAYDAGDTDPWTAGVSWTYSPMSDPISGCMDSIAINYNSNAIFADGSCTYATLSSSPSTLSLEVGVTMTPHTFDYSTPFLADDKQTAASSGDVGIGTHVALDSNGAVHICSKIAGSTNDLSYTTNASGSWQSASIDSTGDVGSECFIALDSNDDIHIIYRDTTNTDLKYATKTLAASILASNWDLSAADNNGQVGNFGSIAIDSQDRLHIAYFSGTGTELKYGTKASDSSTWSNEVVDTDENVGKYTSIQVDSNDKPHITYRDHTNTEMKYAHKMGASWTVSTLDSTTSSGSGTSLAIDSNDHLHVAYKTNSTEMAYMTNQSGSWVKTTLDANSSGSWGVNYVDIMISDGDIPHVVYYDAVDSDIFYMSNARGVWERILVAGDSISKTPSTTMDANGDLHIAYYIDGSFDDMGYAAVRSLTHRPQFEVEPALPTGVLLGAENGTIYGTSNVFTELTQYTVWANTTSASAFTTFSMNVDWELMPSVSTLEVQRNTAITPITFNWTAWSSGVSNSTSSVYTSGDSAWYNSIVIDSNDKAHIVFYRDDNSNLMYSTNKSGSWATSSIETSNNVGKYCNLAIDSSNGLHVSYQYNTGNALKYAYKSASSSSWSTTTIDNTGGKFTSIAIDSNDKPHIAYRDSGGDVGYAEKTGSSWSFSSVQSANDVAFTSIAIDSDDDIHIAYYDANNNDMFHLTDTSGSWVNTYLEDIGSNTGGMSLDIAIDPTTDEPGISYFDSGATSLKYRYYTGSSWPGLTVENGADYGRFNSIAYDSLGNVHISHERNSADDLYYTSDKTGSWISTAVHTTNSAGTYTAIAIDGNDDIHIAYRYNSGTDLYHATVQGYKTGAVSRADVSGATCSITPSLPNGLALNQGTCTISGTPTISGTNTTYNVTATSSTGVSKTGEFNLWVTMVAPSIAYSGSPFTFNKDVAISSITPTNSGDSGTWSASPSLPSGLNIDSSTGVISGTPTATSSSASYVITATNSGGSDTATISITVNAQAPSDLTYAPENMTLEKGAAMTTNTPSVSGGTVTSWTINATLPSGLSFSTSTGAISGTPTVLQTTAVTYTVSASNSGGSTSAEVNITINDVAPSISYSYNDITGTKGVAISPHSGPTTSGGTITSWEISPSPGSAFQFNSANGQISGTPSTVLSRTQYTIWANNSGGQSVAYVNVTINDVAPNTIVYSSHDLILEKGTAMTTTTPAISGGSVTTWSISPSIPNGLAFSSSTGAISGTPTGLQTTAVEYTISATNSGGSTSTKMNITINDQLASVSYPSVIEISNDRTMTAVTPTTSGGAITSWEISPSLPSSLNFGSSNGSIWGTPTGLLENVTYTVFTNNSGGSTNTTFTLGLNWTLTPSVEGVLITRNSSIASDITWEWDYDPLEAQNLSLVTGEWNTCALDNNGNVFCWGRNGNGQIGNGQTGTAGCGSSGHKCKDTPTATNDLGSDVISLAFGHQHACGLLDTGAVKCWGRNNNGQLGTNSGDKDTPQTVNLGSGRTATSIYAGGYFTCAILDDASVKCWGQNDQGQLGIGSTSNTNTPTTINTLGSGRTAVSLATAYNAVCALLDDGSVKCWGDDNKGQLGNGGSNSDITSPPASAINLGTGRTAKAITGGEFHFCAILDDDSIKCWGEGDDGKLGTGSTGIRNTPTSTSGSFASGRYAVAIDAGYDHTCAILDNGQLTCWGSDADGQLGNGATTGTKSSLQSSTVSLGTGRTAISLSAGGEHTCAQLDNGQLKCWGNRADGQVGDNGNFNNPSDRTSPSSVSNNNHGGSTYLNTGVMPSSALAGATCAISPSLPTGLSLTAGTCTITGTPTVTVTNATYTIWANVSGQSFSGQIWLEVGLNAPDISYSSSSYTYTKDIEITTLTPSNVGGEVTTWAINATLPSGLTFETSNGTIWGTPDTITSATTYTIWANNSADSDSLTITFTVNAATPNFHYGSASGGGTPPLVLYLNQTMNPLTPTHASGGGAITSCSSSPSLPSGLSLSSTCVLSGTPDATATGALYTITGTNTGGSDTASLYIEIRSSGGTLSVTPSNTEGSVNSSISDITMSYAHQLSNYGWTSGVSNTTTTLSNNFLTAGGTHLLGIDSGDQGEMVVVYAHNDTSSASGTYSLGMMYRWGGTWTETILDTGTDTGHHPSVAIDRQGAIHIAYIDDHNDELRYATNASGSWVFTTLGSSTYDNDDGRGTAIVVHPITDVVHIVTTINDNTYRDLQYHTNEDGSWVNMTITNTLSDEGHDPAMAMDGDGNLHVAYYCDDGCSDLRMSSRINGVWQNETVASTLNIGNDPDITIDSQGTIHIVSQYLNNQRIYLHSGTPGSWTEQTGLSGGNAHWPVVSVDSNDAVHISYHFGNTQKDVMYMTNASGSWSTASMIEGYGGWGSEMAIDDNDDIFIANLAVGIWNELQLTTVKGSGQGLTVLPIYDISPMLPDGLTMNWRNGTVSGTPTEALANTTFTVTVTALGATTTGTFTLFITGAPGAIAYSDISGTKGTVITSVTPSITTNGTTGSVTSWAINASLPSGLTFETSNGTIWGTPSVVVSGAVFTIWANNSVGPSSTTVNITIGDVGVTAITYPSENITLTVYHTMTTATPSTTGGTATTWGISPSLPSGMSFDSATGAISGTPENLQTTAATYTVWANNSGGDFSDQINITINDYPPVPLNYFGDDITLDYNQTMTPIGDFELRPDLMAAGEDHSCAIKDDGTVRCWGEGANGRLGYGGSTDKNSPTATSSLGTGRTAIDITAGGDHTCAVLDDGSVMCWGANTWGQLGDGTTTSRTSPTQTLSLGRPAVAVEAGMFFTCALLDNGSVSCWGKNNQGQLGRGYTNASSDLSQRTPGLTLPMPGGRPVISMDISHYMVCGVVDNGSIACWSQYGGGHTPSLKTFFNDANPAKDVATGRYSACGLMENGNVTCWGTGFLGTGGSGQTANPGVIWPNLGSGRTAIHVELGRKHNCALLDNNAVKCWGDDAYGQMANGASTSNKNTPTSVSFASGVVVQDIIAGQWHTCIAAQTNEMYCWGDGVYGKLGDGASSQNNFAGSGAKVNHFSGSNPVKAHGDITSWAIHPALPTGLALGSTNGTLYGTPTASTPALGTYTIYANNSGGSSATTIQIMVNDEAPDISYNPDWFELTKGVAMSPTATPINAGGAIPTSILESTGEVGRGTSLAIDANGYKHVTYFDDTNYVLKYATDASGSWVNITLNTITYHQQSSSSSIVIDSGGVLHVAYSGASGNLTYATCSSTCTSNASWTFVEIDDSGSASGSPSLAIDSNNTMHISYIEYNVGTTPETLKYATCSASCTTASSWSNITVDNSFNTANHADIAIDSNDGLHISYFKQTYSNPGYYYATCTSSCNATSSWNTLGLGWGAGLSGLNPTSIVVDSNDVVHFASSYFSGSSGGNGLSIRSCSASCTTGSSAWSSSQVDTSSAYFKIGYISIVVDSNDGLHIAYGIHGQNVYSALHYASCSSSCPSGSSSTSSWSITEIDGTVEAGTISIAIGPNDGVGIVYQDTTNDNIRDVSIDSSANVYGYSVSPDLPAGLSLDIATGEISGTPTALSTNTTYTITVRNSGGTNTTTITIVVNDQVPTIAYSPNDLDLTNNTASSDLPLSPTITGSGTITS